MSALNDEPGRFRCWLCAGLNVSHLHRRTVIVSTCRDCGARRKTPRFEPDDDVYFGQPRVEE